MDLRFDCPRCDSLHQMPRSLDDLREHIARTHLDLALFCCPRCKKTFINAFNAHHHIRNECNISGVLEIKDYTRSLLGMDGTYLAELQALEYEAISNLFCSETSDGSPLARSDSVEYLGVFPAPVKMPYLLPKEEILSCEEPFLVHNDEDINPRSLVTEEPRKKRRMADNEEKAADEENRLQIVTAIQKHFVELNATSGDRHVNLTGPPIVESTPTTPTNIHGPLRNPFPALPFLNGNNINQMMTRPGTNRGKDCVCTSSSPMPKGYRPLSDTGCNYDLLRENVTNICVFRNRTVVKGTWIEGLYSRQGRKGIIWYWHNGREYSDIRPLHPACMFKAIGIKESVNSQPVAIKQPTL